MSVTIITGISEYHESCHFTCVVCGARFDSKCSTNFRQLCFEITSDWDLKRAYRCFKCYFHECIFISAGKYEVNMLEPMLLDAMHIGSQNREPIETVFDNFDREAFMKQLKPPTGCSSCHIEGMGKLLCECSRVAYCDETCKRRDLQVHKDECFKYRTYPLFKTLRRHYTDVIENKTKEIEQHQRTIAYLQHQIAELQVKIDQIP